MVVYIQVLMLDLLCFLKIQEIFDLFVSFFTNVSVFFCYYIFMITSKDMKFITVDKQEDLPTELEIKGRLHDATQLEELVMPNGDIIVACEENSKISSKNLKKIIEVLKKSYGGTINKSRGILLL